MTEPQIKLDRTNIRLLAALQLDASLTNHELSELVHLSPSACHGRVRAMERAGVIRRYITDIEADLLGRTISAFVEVSLESHKPADFRAFEMIVEATPEIIWSYKTSGDADYLMLIIVPDMARLRELTDGLLDSGVGVTNLTTVPILQKVKPFSGLPLQQIVELSE